MKKRKPKIRWLVFDWNELGDPDQWIDALKAYKVYGYVAPSSEGSCTTIIILSDIKLSSKQVEKVDRDMFGCCEECDN